MADVQTPATPTPQTPPAQTTPPAPVQKAEEKKAEEKKSFKKIVRSFNELISEISPISNNKDLWLFTYRIHCKDFFNITPQQKEDIIPFEYMELCHNAGKYNRLERLTEFYAKTNSNMNPSSAYPRIHSVNIKNLSVKSLCSTCEGDLAFCPYKMAVYIEYVCKSNNLDVEAVYQQILAEKYRKKPEYPAFAEMAIPAEDYSFLEVTPVMAAMTILKNGYLCVSAITDSQIVYNYVPLCKKVKKSQIPEIINFYVTKNDVQDRLYFNQLKENLTENRGCGNCLYKQCPDRVAAYICYLSDKYNVDALTLARFIIEKNKTKGVSLNGNFYYFSKMRQLENIPFTNDSKKQIDGIIKYIINRFSVGSDKIPLFPFNMVIHTNDENFADEIGQFMANTSNYYGYLKNTNFKTMHFSKDGFNGIINAITGAEKDTILLLKEMELIRSVGTAENLSLQMTKLTNAIKDNNKKVFVIVSGEKRQLDSALGEYKDFYDGLLAYRLQINDMSQAKVVELIMEELTQNYDVEEGFKETLEYYVIDKYGESELKSKAFIDLTIETILFNHFNREINISNTLLCKDIPATQNRRSNEEIWEELNSLTGLENVKSEVKGIEQYLTFQKKLSESGNAKMQKPNMHMVFTGNPGTGKTTVARLMAEILHGIGFIKQNKVIECSAKDLIGKYIGHTAPLTAQKCEAAYGGVLFIDEAYTLATNTHTNTDAFREECIAELIKQMEDNRDRLVVIFAGYTKEMQDLLDSNPGFESRIAKKLEFSDYSTDELLSMFVNLVIKNGLRLDDDAYNRLSMILASAREQENFGNARYIRNLFEKTLQEHAKNTYTSEDPDVITTITLQDIVQEIPIKQETYKIGFDY